MEPNQMTYQADPQAAGAALAIFGVVLLFVLVIVLVLYVYMAICYMKIAKKTNTSNAWLAWIPIANIYLLTKIAQKPGWWLLLFLIPLVNIVVSVLVWMEIAKTLKKPDWLGILIIVPIANLVIPGYLAFSKVEETVNVDTPQIPPTPAV